MVKNKTSLTLSAILLLMLSACTLGTSNPNNPVIGDPPLTATVEMRVNADTSAPINAVGQSIQYTYSIKNIGTVPLPGVVTIVGATATCPPVNTIGNKDEFLDVGEELICDSSYITVQADLDAGSITSVTTANVNGTLSNPVTTTVLTVPDRLLTLSKTANPTDYGSMGQTITYTYVVTNSGTLPIGPAQFVVTDTGLSTPINCGNADTTLAPNTTVTCSAPYVVTQTDMNAVAIVTSATVSGGGVGPSQPASLTVNKSVINPPNLTPGTTIQHPVKAGEWLLQIARCYGANYNTVRGANPQISNPHQISPNTTLSVPNIGSDGNIYGPPCVVFHTVQSGETWESIAQIYNADVVVLKTANLNHFAVGIKLKVPINSAGSTVVPESKKLTLTTAANPQTYNQAGQAITYTYVVKNSGNTSLGPAQFTVSDSLIGTVPINCGAADTTLAPDAMITCTATYTISLADMEVLSITNNATASGGGAGPSQPANTILNKSVPTLKLTTVANPLTFNQVGQVITYTYAIENNGTASLGPAQFTVSDSLIGTVPINCGAADTTLIPSASVTCIATYTITETDMTAVLVTNNATASGGGAGPSEPASITINKE